MKQSNNEDILLSVEVYQNILNNKLKRFPMGFWQEEDPADIIKYLIEEHLKWTDDDIKNKLCADTFRKNKLAGMLKIIFNNSPYQAINATYPNRFKPWELSCAPFQFWNKETGVEAIRWLIEEKLKWSDDDIKNNLDLSVFDKNSLRGMISIVFNDSTYEAINEAYPSKFKPWDISTPKNYWNIKTGIDATIYLIEEKLKWSEEDIKECLQVSTFRDTGLGAMITIVFNTSPFEAINAAYPNQFKPWELKKSPQNYWDKESSINAIKWLFEEKLNWSDEQIKKDLNLPTFRKNNLGGMMGVLYNDCLFDAINTAYPNRFKPWELKHVPSYYLRKINKKAV